MLFRSDRKSAKKGEASELPVMPKSEEKKRIVALILVFIVVIFFWMSFHQNGLTLTFFARDYTAKAVDPFTNLFFYLWSFLSVLGAIYGLVFLVRKNSKPISRAIGAGLLIAGSGLAYYFYNSFSGENPIDPEIFQSFNPIYIVALTPLVIGIFNYLKSKGKEPSTPRKIGYGMILASLGFVIMATGSFGLASPFELDGAPSPDRVSPYLLMSTYWVLTIAELFLSPMGLSFVSKVAPPRFQGLMQGGWLGATALGNALLFVGSSLWGVVEVWQVWVIFVVCCLLSAAFIFSIMKRLESATK